MLETLFTNPLAFVIIFGGIVLAITVHEFAHAFVADKLGDPTPRYQGRVTLNPLAHLDPLGTIAMLLTSFGWGKPVEFDPYNLKEPVRDTALIAAAGPLSNLIVASLLSILLQLSLLPFAWLEYAIMGVILINISLAIFNLIPVYPLDGSKIILVLLPPATAHEYESFMHRYGTLVLIFLLVPWQGASPASFIVSPIVNIISSLLL